MTYSKDKRIAELVLNVTEIKAQNDKLIEALERIVEVSGSSTEHWLIARNALIEVLGDEQSD